MRIDAQNLLNRLGRQDFAYKVFEDRFTELELWPILEALLRDPRLQAIDRAEAAGAMAPVGIQNAPLVSNEPITGLLSRYGQSEETKQPAAIQKEKPAQDVRALLRRVSDLAAKGEI